MAFSSLSSGQRLTVLMELLGGPEYSARMKAAAASTNLFGRSVQTAGRRTFIANQAIYTLRRYAFFATIAVTGMVTAVARLGYTYLNAMQQARVALGPVIKDQATLNNYLRQLFQISKYSPFVISDLTKSFSALDLALGPIGVSGQTVIDTLSSVVDYLSVLQQTTPMAMRRVTNALADLAYQGYLTGRMYQRLAQIGIPIQSILRTQLGVTPDQVKNIASLQIPASAVLDAIRKYAKVTPGISGAARRISLRSFGGLVQVARDTVSQISGNLIQGIYGNQKGGVQGALYKLLKPGGPLDRLSNQKGSKGTLFYLNKQVTGNTGLARGFLLLLSITRNLGAVFARVLIPAFVIALHSLIIFYPILKLINAGLGFLAKHATVAKFIFAALATEFIITHSALTGAWLGMKLWRIATFGSIKPIMSLIKYLKIMRTIELASGIKAWSKWAFMQTEVVSKLGGVRTLVYTNNGLLGRMSRLLLTRVVPGLKAAALWGNRVKLAFLGWSTYIIAVVIGLRRLDKALNNQHKMTQFRGGWWNPVTWLAYPGQKILGRHGSSGGGTSSMNIPRTNAIGSPNANASGQVAVGRLGIPNPVIHTQLIVDRKVLAEAVSRANQDKRARR